MSMAIDHFVTGLRDATTKDGIRQQQALHEIYWPEVIRLAQAREVGGATPGMSAVAGNDPEESARSDTSRMADRPNAKPCRTEGGQEWNSRRNAKWEYPKNPQWRDGRDNAPFNNGNRFNQNRNRRRDPTPHPVRWESDTDYPEWGNSDHTSGNMNEEPQRTRLANSGYARSTQWNARRQDTVITTMTCTGGKGHYPTAVVDDDPIDWDAKMDDVISKAFAHFERCLILSDDS